MRVSAARGWLEVATLRGGQSLMDPVAHPCVQGAAGDVLSQHNLEGQISVEFGPPVGLGASLRQHSLVSGPRQRRICLFSGSRQTGCIIHACTFRK